MEYRIELGGLVLTGEADPMDIAALARELAATNVRELPSNLALGAGPREPEPAPAPQPQPQPLPLGNGHGPATVEHTLPESCYTALREYTPQVTELPATSRNAGPGRQYILTLDTLGAVNLYEYMNFAIDEGGAKRYPGLYHQRLRLREVLDKHFHIDADDMERALLEGDANGQ